MTQPTTPGSREQMWHDQFSEVDREISKMAALTGIDLLDRSQVQRVPANDAGVCRHDNALAFYKLHTLLTAHHLLRDRAADEIGQAGAQAAIDDVVVQLMRKFGAAASASGQP
jgi:hypothetical protein